MNNFSRNWAMEFGRACFAPPVQ